MMTQFTYVLHSADFVCEWGDVCHSSYFKQTQRGRSVLFAAICPCACLSLGPARKISEGQSKQRVWSREERHVKNLRLYFLLL